MSIKEKIKNNPALKQLTLRILMPRGQARPRWWVRCFIHPFIVKKEKYASIRRHTRMDVFPFNRFFLGSESTIEDFCTINNASGNVCIGKRTRIGIGSVIIGPVHIGDDVRLAQHVIVTALNHNYEDTSRPISRQGVNTAPVYIGDETWIGSNSVILPGLLIGKHCVIAAGTVVTKNVPPFCVVAGNPGRIIKKYNPDTGVWDRV